MAVACFFGGTNIRGLRFESPMASGLAVAHSVPAATESTPMEEAYAFRRGKRELRAHGAFHGPLRGLVAEVDGATKWSRKGTVSSKLSIPAAKAYASSIGLDSVAAGTEWPAATPKTIGEPKVSPLIFVPPKKYVTAMESVFVMSDPMQSASRPPITSVADGLKRVNLVRLLAMREFVGKELVDGDADANVPNVLHAISRWSRQSASIPPWNFFTFPYTMIITRVAMKTPMSHHPGL